MSAGNAFANYPIPRLVAWSLLPAMLTVLGEYLVVAPVGGRFFHGFDLFIGLAVMAAVPSVVVALVLLSKPHYRPEALRILVASVLIAVTVPLSFWISSRIRADAFQKLAERSLPLVRAIREYEARHGTPPPDLRALVPEFLPAVPDTGMAGYPRYKYHVGEKSQKRFDGNPWALEVFTPAGGFNFDLFLYFPLQNYPQHGYGGSLERVRDWAYVHE
jgi:hypothetical protein